MANASVPSAFEGFKRLSSSNYVYEPPSTATSSADNGPSVIVFASWMDAAPKHIAKYLNYYKQSYPHARILLITTTSWEFIFRTKARDLKRVDRVVTALESLPSDAKVLLHSMSNAGGCVSCMLAIEYRKRRNAPLPIDAMVLDSAPGLPRYWQGHTAMMYGMPQNFVGQFFGGILMHIFLFTYTAFHNIFFIEDAIRAERRMLNTESLFAKDVPRLYIYSPSDKIVWWPDIESHIDAAKKLGWPVDSVKFEGSGHAAHMMKHSGQYWEAVTQLWKGL